MTTQELPAPVAPVAPTPVEAPVAPTPVEAPVAPTPVEAPPPLTKKTRKTSDWNKFRKASKGLWDRKKLSLEFKKFKEEDASRKPIRLENLSKQERPKRVRKKKAKVETKTEEEVETKTEEITRA